MDNGTWPSLFEANISDSYFAHNSASGVGGAYCMNGSAGSSYDYLHLTSSNFSKNTASSGGAVYLGLGFYYMGVDGCTLEQNECSTGRGCAIAAYGDRMSPGNVLLQSSQFMGNNIADSAQVYDDSVSDLTDFEQCAGAHFGLGQCMGISNCSFADNHGAGLCVTDYSGTCEQAYSLDDINYQTTESPDVYLQLFNRTTVAGLSGVESLTSFLGTSGISLDIRNSIFLGNAASSRSHHIQDPVTGMYWLGSSASGGGMYIEGITGGVLARVTFSNNTAFSGAGAYLNSCSAIVVWECTLDSNTATLGHGGAIFLSDNKGAGMMLGNSKLLQNHAVQGGGGFACESPSSLLTTNGTRFISNSAQDGGGVYCYGCKEVTLQLDSHFEANSAANSGGAVSVLEPHSCRLARVK